MALDLLLNIYKIVIQYKGTHYLGFQVQAEGKTIQGEINKVLEILSKSSEVKSLGSGRTDTGVHALGQVLKVEIPVDIPGPSLMKAMNSHLPSDIRVMSSEKISQEFHPIYSAKSKEYHYLFSTEKNLSPLVSELVTSFPYELDIELINRGCALLCGEHDFKNFQCVGTEVETSIRTIYSCEVVHHVSSGEWHSFLNDYYVFKITGSGFLKQMVRLIMGALINLGRGKVTLEEFEKSLNVPMKNRLGATAPPQGLYLKSVEY